MFFWEAMILCVTSEHFHLWWFNDDPEHIHNRINSHSWWRYCTSYCVHILWTLAISVNIKSSGLISIHLSGCGESNVKPSLHNQSLTNDDALLQTKSTRPLQLYTAMHLDHLGALIELTHRFHNDKVSRNILHSAAPHFSIRFPESNEG
jgi:hypothetical protein